MQRSIMVSTDVYAAIWAARKPGENSEDDVLNRLLCGRKGAEKPGSAAPAVHGAIGFGDRRNGVVFPEGFRIFRDYKNGHYEAVATGGRWLRVDTGQSFSSLNQLNGTIADGNENVWIGSWKYLDESGRERPISDLRK